MKRTSIFIITAIVAAMGALVACHENIFDETEDINNDEKENGTTYVSVVAEIGGNVINDSDYSVYTLLDECSLSGAGCEIETIINDLPQFFYVKDNNDQIILVSRTVVSEGATVYVNEESTALALATFNPLFANSRFEDYHRIESLIVQSQAYPKYLSIIKETIVNGKEVFDENNTDLLVALNDIFEEICSSIDVDAHNERAIFTRSSNIVGINTDPVMVETYGTNVTIRNKGLIPTYECVVYNGGRVVDTRLIQSHKSYGFLDLFSTEENLVYGAPEVFSLHKDGEYQFYLDRTSERAINDFSRRLWGDVLSMVGLYGSTPIMESSVAAISAIGALLVNPDTNMQDVVKTVSGLIFNIGVGIKWPVAGALLNKINVVYNVLKGFSNEMARSILGFTTPYYIDFCICSYENSITSCTETELEKYDGDEQEGFPGQRLLLPLTVKTKVFADDGTEIERSSYQKVKYEVVSGGGSVSEEIVGTETDSQLASTYWTLGDEGEQKVKAVIVDMVTGAEVSSPVFFTAKLRENADLTIRLDWRKLSGDTDIDLHVTDPFGEEIAYYNMTSASGGWLDRDDLVGPGPEHICWREAPSGVYLVQVHYYGSQSHAVTDYTVTINASGEEFGPFKGSIGYNNLITIGTLTLPDGTFTRSVDNSQFDLKNSVEYNVQYPTKK